MNGDLKMNKFDIHTSNTYVTTNRIRIYICKVAR